MKTIKFRLTLDVEISPQGETRQTLIRNLQQVVVDAVNNGTLTANTSATVETYSSKVKEVVRRDVERRKTGEHRFSSPINGLPFCSTCGCDEDDAFVAGQKCEFKA